MNIDSKILDICVKQEYGRTRYYPANKLAVMFVMILNRATFTLDQLKKLKDVGYTVNVVHRDMYTTQDDL